MHDLQDPLKTLADKFLTHRGARLRCTFPKAFWREAFSLSKLYPISQIAQAIHLHPVYVKRKFKQLAQASVPNDRLEFTQIRLQQPPQASSTCLEFTTATGRPISIRFQATVSELLPLVQALAGV